MAIVTQGAFFAVISTGDSVRLEAALRAIYPEDHTKITHNCWIVAATGTSKEVSDRLGVSDGSNGTALVARFTNYYGRASSQLWEWMNSKTGAANG